MKRLMNQVGKIRDEALDGFALAHAETVELGAEREYVKRRQVKPGKVALISGGGAGHEPLHIGFVGHGMLDAACPGQIFTSPNPNQMLNAAKAVDGGAGILLHQHLVAVRREFAHAGRGQANAIFVILDFLGYADEHDRLLLMAL